MWKVIQNQKLPEFSIENFLSSSVAEERKTPSEDYNGHIKLQEKKKVKSVVNIHLVNDEKLKIFHAKSHMIQAQEFQT